MVARPDGHKSYFFTVEYNGLVVGECIYTDGHNLWLYRVYEGANVFHSVKVVNVESGGEDYSEGLGLIGEPNEPALDYSIYWYLCQQDKKGYIPRAIRVQGRSPEQMWQALLAEVVGFCPERDTLPKNSETDGYVFYTPP